VAKFVATDVAVTLNGTAISSSLNSVELNISSDEVDTTSFGSSGWKTVVGGRGAHFCPACQKQKRTRAASKP